MSSPSKTFIVSPLPGQKDKFDEFLAYIKSMGVRTAHEGEGHHLHGLTEDQLDEAITRCCGSRRIFESEVGRIKSVDGDEGERMAACGVPV